ncbi:RNA polymerase sigma factor [Mariniluteicoccus flavus]
MTLTEAPSDRDLWRRLLEADEDAFSEIFHRHSGAVYNHAFRRLADWDQAQDVTQKVFA